MASTLWKILLPAAALLALGGATCQSTRDAESDAAPVTAEGDSSPAPLPADSGSGGGQPDSTLGIPGMDFSQLSPNARRELATVFTDEFCYCGCPHTLGQCLKQHTQCRHAKRMASLAARHVENGFPGSETILILSKYYEGFRAPRKSIPVDPRMCVGNEKAEVTLVEFFDYECPYCGAVAPVLEAFAKKHAAKVRFCAVPFAIQSHPNSVPASQAALMARDAGKFWELHHKLFENQMSLSGGTIRQLAASVGLNAEQVGKDLAAGKYVDQVNAMRELGRAAGVDSTPSLFLNGRKFQLDVSEQNLTHTVDDELEWVANKGAWAKD